MPSSNMSTDTRTRAERLDDIVTTAHAVWRSTNDPTIKTLAVLIERLAEELRDAPELREP
jgi:hypothetical protein